MINWEADANKLARLPRKLDKSET